MSPNNRSPAPRLALALGLVAGIWPVASPATPGAATAAQADAAAAAADPGRIVLAQADAAAESPVSYARDQADRGESRFDKVCVDCHGKDLKGGLNGGAPLRGMAFEEKYFGNVPASWLFEFLSTRMPPNSPGRFSPTNYADLMAYILKRNGFQPGAPLPADLDALDRLVMEK